jgi:plastocyanin
MFRIIIVSAIGLVLGGCSEPIESSAGAEGAPSRADSRDAAMPIDGDTILDAGPDMGAPDLAMLTVHAVHVGQGGLSFAPSNLTISVGDTVRWIWDSSHHNVVSGTDGTADGLFCSPSDHDCANAPASAKGSSYDHTFSAAGTFPYFCSFHFDFGMTGIITVR